MHKVIYLRRKEPRRLIITRPNYKINFEESLRNHLLSKYDIDLGEELGRGGVGIVYRAKERTCGQDLVVKTIIQDSSEERQAISGYNTCELTDFLEKQDPDTNKEIHREIAKRALGRYVSQ